ncbi:hypothetical protein G9A89_000707 [Geosiphon pyriformis]|nr:hypothetical protein G9A89_000707 [Geosiphon pyriformis]
MSTNRSQIVLVRGGGSPAIGGVSTGELYDGGLGRISSLQTNTHHTRYLDPIPIWSISSMVLNSICSGNERPQEVAPYFKHALTADLGTLSQQPLCSQVPKPVVIPKSPIPLTSKVLAFVRPHGKSDNRYIYPISGQIQLYEFRGIRKQWGYWGSVVVHNYISAYLLVYLTTNRDISLTSIEAEIPTGT